jgi:hypothetical protein
MDYFINRGSTLNSLKMELIQDGRNSYKDFFDAIQNANIYFSMVDVDDATIKISKQPAGCMIKTDTPLDSEEEYYIVYNWREKDVNRSGTYRGQFFIEFLGDSNNVESTLIVPIKEILYIHVLDGLIKRSY